MRHRAIARNWQKADSKPADRGPFRYKDWQKNEIEIARDARLLILNGPMGSAKSIAGQGILVDHISPDPKRFAIVAVPQNPIGACFKSNDFLPMPDGTIGWHPFAASVGAMLGAGSFGRHHPQALASTGLRLETTALRAQARPGARKKKLLAPVVLATASAQCGRDAMKPALHCRKFRLSGILTFGRRKAISELAGGELRQRRNGSERHRLLA